MLFYTTIFFFFRWIVGMPSIKAVTLRCWSYVSIFAAATHRPVVGWQAGLLRWIIYTHIQWQSDYLKLEFIIIDCEEFFSKLMLMSAQLLSFSRSRYGWWKLNVKLVAFFISFLSSLTSFHRQIYYFLALHYTASLHSILLLSAVELIFFSYIEK